ncbi:MAG: LptA/OstA family protein [Cyanobium sp.]
MFGLAGTGLLLGSGLLVTSPSLSAAPPTARPAAAGGADPQAAAPTPAATTGTPSAAPAAAAPPRSAAPPASPAAAGNGLVQIESDSQQADNSTGVITATGNVRITYPDRRMLATARQAQYYSREGRLVLSGDVDVLDADGQRIRAERLVYLLDSERLQAEPGRGRQVITRLRLQPRPGATAAPTLLP